MSFIKLSLLEMSCKYVLSIKIISGKYQYFPRPVLIIAGGTCKWNILTDSHPGVLPADGSITLLF